ncbi:MAG: c-type cytochrome [Candidatus Brocadia sp.]
MKKMTYIGMAAGFLACFFLTVAFSNAKPTVQKKEKTTFSIRNGGEIFKVYCAACHGENGKGNGRYYVSEFETKPADFTKAEIMSNKSDAYLFDFITRGSAVMGKSVLCPPWGHTLVADEIKDVIIYLRTLVAP